MVGTPTAEPAPVLPETELAPGYRIPRLIRGTWQLHEAAKRLDREAALDDLIAGCAAGFTAIEAADSYDGVEDLLGALRTVLGGRFDLRVHTRVSQIGPDPLTPAAVRDAVATAQRRLRHERLDLVQLQWWNLDRPGWVEAALVLAKMREAGDIAHIGVANFPIWALTKLLDAGVPVVSNQVQISLLDPRAGNGLAAFCRVRGVHLLGYGALAGGFLSQTWLGQPMPGLVPTGTQRFGRVYRMLIDRFGGWPWLQELLVALKQCAERHDTDIANIAIAWVLQYGNAAAMLVGASDTQRLRSYARAAALTLDAADCARIDSVLAHRAPIAGEVAEIERASLLGAIARDYRPGT